MLYYESVIRENRAYMIKIPGGGEYKFIKQLLRVLAGKAYILTPQSKILDFGCGSGKDVHCLRKSGFDAYGFDIHDYSSRAHHDCRKYLRFMDNPVKELSNYKIDWDGFRLPFSDSEFDFVFSRDVLEHVQDHDTVLNEIKRVMKPVSVSIHTYVPRYVFIEPHMFIPFGGIIKNYKYYLFWALCGIRKKSQAGKTAREAAKSNIEYALTSINYITPKTMLKKARAYFSNADFIPQSWHHQNRPWGWMLRNPVLRLFYNYAYNAVLLLEKY